MAGETEVKLDLPRAREPRPNAHVESFHAVHACHALAPGRSSSFWRCDDDCRPHGSLGDRTASDTSRPDAELVLLRAASAQFFLGDVDAGLVWATLSLDKRGRTLNVVYAFTHAARLVIAADAADTSLSSRARHRRLGPRLSMFGLPSRYASTTPRC